MSMESCPNCGAPLEGRKCSYRGTAFEFPIELALGHEVPALLEIGGRLYAMKLCLNEIDVENDYTELYADGAVYRRNSNCPPTVRIECVPASFEYEGRMCYFVSCDSDNCAAVQLIRSIV